MDDYYEKIQNRIGETIRNERKKQNYSQMQLAEIAGIHYNYLGEIERAEKSPTFITLLKICFALGMDILDFISLIDFRN